jgi:hypothetical protein
MSDLYDFNSTFFLSLATMVFGFLAGALGYALKSKCTSVKLCGCIEIIRDVELEADIEEQTQPPQSNEIPPPTIPIIRSRHGSPRHSRLNLNLVDFAESVTGSRREDETKT